MFYIEIDRVLLEIGTGKSELFGPDKYKIVVLSNHNNEEEAKMVKEKLSNEGPYHQYTFEILTTENILRDNIRVILIEKTPQLYMPYVPITSVTVDEQPLQTLCQRFKLTTVDDMFKESLSLLEPKTLAKFNTKSK